MAHYAKKHSGRLNFTDAICGAAASLPKCNVYATQAKNAQPLLPLRFGNRWACTMSTLSAASLSASKKRRRNGYVRICRRFIKIKIGNSSRFAKACGCSVCRRLKIGARNVFWMCAGSRKWTVRRTAKMRCLGWPCRRKSKCFSTRIRLTKRVNNKDCRKSTVCGCGTMRTVHSLRISSLQTAHGRVFRIRPNSMRRMI